MFQAHRPAYIRRLHALVPLCLALLCAACSVSTITLSGNYPAPLTRKLPLTVGVYYPEELRSFSYVETDDESGEDQYIIESGAAQVQLFNTVLPAMFESVVQLDTLEMVGANPQLDAVFVPVLEEFQLGLPSKTKLNVYEIWLKYNMRLSKANGDYIADWVMTAYGKSPDENFQSVDAGVKDAATVAMRDLAASLSLGFAGVAGIDEWLRENDSIP
ncbi:MAG TPA: hypothetical protein VNR18_14095 [Hyphomicrobiales bacterium]|nr:hypothetical protein [Hyphomicrobiales bacterium]